MLRFLLVTLPLKRKQECWMHLVLQLQKRETMMFFLYSQSRNRIGDCATTIPSKAENKATTTAFRTGTENVVLIFLLGGWSNMALFLHLLRGERSTQLHLNT